MPGTNTILLDTDAWDLVLDINGNIAAASEPYSLAQDAASAIKTFLGEVFFDTSLGVPYLTDILAKRPSLQLMKSEFVAAAMTVPGVASAKCFLSDVSARQVVGQVQVISQASGQRSAASFTVINPQGTG